MLILATDQLTVSSAAVFDVKRGTLLSQLGMLVQVASPAGL